MKESIKKYLNGKAEFAELQILMKWLKHEPDSLDWKDTKAEWTYHRMNAEMGDQESIAWSKIKKSMAASAEMSRQRKLRICYQAAAIFMLLLSVTVFLWKNQNMKNLMTSVMTDKGQISRVVLPDSTVVWLNSGSAITYDNAYSVKNRTIKLEGEAFFNVKKNKSLPFHVLTGNHDIKVTGTSFLVSNYHQFKTVDVVLEEGSVHVLNKLDNTSARLIPNQKYSYNKMDDFATIEKVVPENYTSWRNGTINFYQLRLEDIAKKLELKYNQPFVLKQGIKDKHFTFSIVDENLSEVLSMIEVISDIKAKQVNDSIYLK